VKATQHLIRTIQGQPDAPQDELQGIQQLRDLITGAAKHTPEPKLEIESIPAAPNPADMEIVASNPVPAPIQISPDPIHMAPHVRVEPAQPTVIPFDDTKYELSTEPEPCYNLRSHTRNMVQSAINMVGAANTQDFHVSAVIDDETGD
jgi:hypothetical protein